MTSCHTQIHKHFINGDNTISIKPYKYKGNEQLGVCEIGKCLCNGLE